MNQEHAASVRAAIAAVMAFFTSLWGWFGWLVVVWVLCMSIDYLAGYASAMKRGEWSGKVAREGLWHKGSCIIVVVTAIILDSLVGYLLQHIPGIQLPFDYSMFLSGLVLVWYTLMELGSIMEQVGHMGAPVPPFLKRAIAGLRSSVTAAADQAIPGEESAEEPEEDGPRKT